MASGRRTGWDPLAAIAAAIAMAMMGIYVGLINQQGDRPVVWFLGGLAAAALLLIYAVAHAAPWRALALALSGVMLTVLGTLGILSIGFPILCAGVLALVAAARAVRSPST